MRVASQKWRMMAEWKDKRVEREGGLAGRWVPCGVGQSAHLLEKQWAADTTQQVWMRLPAQKLFPM